MKALLCPLSWLMILLVLPGQVLAQNTPSLDSPELGRVSEGTFLAAHIRLKNLLSSPPIKPFRDFLEKAGPKAMSTLVERFQITPFEMDRVTFVLKNHSDDISRTDLQFAVMVATSVDISPKNLSERLEIPLAVVDGSPFPLWVNKEQKLALALPKPRLVIFGNRDLVEIMAKAKDGAGAPSFSSLGDHDVSIIGNLSILPESIKNGLSPEMRPFLKAKKLLVTYDQGSPKTVAQDPLVFQLDFSTEDEAKEADSTLRGITAVLLKSLGPTREQYNQMLFKADDPRPAPYAELPEALMALYGLSTLVGYEEFLKNPPLRRTGTKLTVTFDHKAVASQTTTLVYALGVGVLVPAVQKVRQAAERMTSSNNLKQIGLAAMNYNDSTEAIPANIVDKKTGKPLLSWRVALLPYLDGEEELYKSFKLDEPWDSPHNIKLARRQVKTYSFPGETVARDNQGLVLTPYQVFTGPKSAFEPGKKINYQNITDGSSQTILAVECKNQVVWTKPDDIPFQPGRDFPPLPNWLGGNTPNGFQAVFFDGSVRLVPYDVPPATLKAMITINGGEEIR